MKQEDMYSVGTEVVTAAPFRKSNSHYATWGKRAVDIVFSLMVMPIVLTVIVILWIANLGSDQRLIFTQPRVGKNGKTFKCYKFQTMVNDAETVLADMCAADPDVKEEWDKYQKLENDPRITKIGRFLRKTSLDELPQFINVLLGDMSVVGPRPFMVEQKEIYVAAGGSRYFDLRPGITGNWQIEGRSRTSFLSRIEYDNLYSRKSSLSEDSRLIGKTATMVLRMTGT